MNKLLNIKYLYGKKKYRGGEEEKITLSQNRQAA